MSEAQGEYFEICVPCQSSEVDRIEEFLINTGACSVTFRDAQDMAILEPGPGQMPLWLELEITAMYSLKDFEKEAVLLIVGNQFLDRKVKCQILENQIWERTWLEHFKPMKFGNNTWIIPSEFEAIDSTAVNILLDPGLAFGTGTHATTALCLEWIDKQDMSNKKAIDFGSGSGILAIAALKHKAKKVYCTDIDPQAIESTIENCKNNNVQSAIEVVQPNDIVGLENIDIVMANILAAPLMGLVKVFHQMLKPKGDLIMSGILKEQTDEIIKIFSPYFVDFQVTIKDDWASVYAQNKIHE